MEKKPEMIGDKKPPILILDQFHVQRNEVGAKEVYCYRPTCEGCRFDPTCQREVTSLEIGEGFNIRRAFRSRPGWKLVSIDYKTIEIRVAAIMSREPFWMNAFQDGRDLHEEMARVAYKIPASEPVPKHLRDAAKQCNFAAIYLCKPYTLMSKSALTLDEAADLLGVWKKTVTTYLEWTDKVHREMLTMWKEQKTAYVTTYWGRRRYLDSLLSKCEKTEDPKKRKSQFEHILSAAVNSPIQGSAADLMKFGIVELMNWIEQEQLYDVVHPLLTVHDEMVLEISEQHGLARFEELCETASQKLTLVGTNLLDGWDPVKVETDIEVGDNWAKAKLLKDYLAQASTTTISLPSPPTPLVFEEPLLLLDPMTEQECYQRHVDLSKTIVVELRAEFTRPGVDPDIDPLNQTISSVQTMLWKAGFPLRRKFVDPNKPYLASCGKKLYYLVIAGHRDGEWSPYKKQHSGTFSLEEVMDFYEHNASFRKICKKPKLFDDADLVIFDQAKPKAFLTRKDS